MSDTRSGAPNRDAGKEQVSATAMGKTGEVIDANNLKSSSVGVVRLVQVQTGGGAEVAGPWCSANARAEVETDRYNFSGTPIPGMFGASVTYSASEDTRGVIITSSTIEDSFFKTQAAFVSPSDFRSGSPMPPQPGPYSVKWQRNDDGSIRTDSVAQWDSVRQTWLGGGSFTSNEVGFIAPTRTWSLSGGTATGSAGDELQSGKQSIILGPIYGANGVSGIALGGNAGGSGMTRHSTLKVKVTDGPGTDGVTAENTFDINWHLPYDNWQLTGSTEPLKILDDGASSWVGAGGPIDITYRPQNLTAAAAHEIVAGVAGVASAGTAFFGGPVGAGVGTLLAVASITIVATAPDPQTRSETTHYGMWENAVGVQRQINSGDPNAGDTTQRVFPASLADAAQLHPEDHDKDPDWMSLMVHCVLVREEVTDFYSGDGYDSNGYIGPEHGHLTYKKPGYEKIWQFRVADRPTLSPSE